ncbi:DNA-binding transcriptional regulator, LysR family [Roseovarius marisflavi]|uniref:DNA-binding transcriptional regulator, LysR family n=2 Tax=Roseovarius marisflavi TaxID=1054996 RepID=A0A1M6YVZ7_9RHOB|nr:DNA-binding transcriptional regulator, LysR family [Roseovarius marisflavi]
MDIRQMRYFIAISESPSLSVAANTLGVAQPSLSQNVVRMEEELGVRLVERSPRGTVLTDDGTLFLKHARIVCAAFENCLDEMREAGGALRGKVSFGMPSSVSMVMSVPLAETVRVEFPDLRLRAIEAMSGYIKTWIDDGTVDIGFIYDLARADHFRTIHVLNERLFFFSAPDAWPLDTPPGTPVRLRDLQKLELILPSPLHGLRKTIEDYAQPRGVKLNVTVEMDAMTQIKELVARGSGYAIFAPAAAHDFATRGDLVKSPICDPDMVRPVYLASNPARKSSRACRAIAQVTLDVARDLVRRGIWEGELEA